MRYKVGQKVWTIGFKLRNHNTDEIEDLPFFVKPDPYFYDIEDIFFKELTITKHEKVSSEFTEEKKYDGYQATDSKGIVWNNQYPKASHSQTSNEADFLFDMKDIEKYIDEGNEKGLSYKEITENIRKDHPFINASSLTYFMNGLDGGLLDENNQSRMEREYPDVYKKLQKIANQVVEKFKQETGLNLKSEEKPFMDKYFRKYWYIE